MSPILKLFVTVLSVGLMFSLAQAQEKKIKRTQLPAAVEKTVAQESQGATIKGFTTEMEKGQRLYEVEMTVEGHTKDILMDKTGNIVEIEEEVLLDSLPSSVRDALMKAAKSGTIETVESIKKGGQIVAYEGHVRTGKKRSEIQVGPNGETLKRPE